MPATQQAGLAAEVAGASGAAALPKDDRRCSFRLDQQLAATSRHTEVIAQAPLGA